MVEDCVGGDFKEAKINNIATDDVTAEKLLSLVRAQAALSTPPLPLVADGPQGQQPYLIRIAEDDGTPDYDTPGKPSTSIPSLCCPV